MKFGQKNQLEIQFQLSKSKIINERYSTYWGWKIIHPGSNVSGKSLRDHWLWVGFVTCTLACKLCSMIVQQRWSCKIKICWHIASKKASVCGTGRNATSRDILNGHLAARTSLPAVQNKPCIHLHVYHSWTTNHLDWFIHALLHFLVKSPLMSLALYA